MTLGQVKEATLSSTINATRFFPFIGEACDTFQLNTPARQLCFLSQVGHESGGLFYREELAGGAAYEGRRNLGNSKPIDAGANLDNYILITKKINDGINSLNERLNRYKNG